MNLFRACRVLRSAGTIAHVRAALTAENSCRLAAERDIVVVFGRREAATHRVHALRVEAAVLLSEQCPADDAAMHDARAALQRAYDDTDDAQLTPTQMPV